MAVEYAAECPWCHEFFGLGQEVSDYAYPKVMECSKCGKLVSVEIEIKINAKKIVAVVG